MVAAGAAHPVEVVDGLRQRVERLVVVEVTGHEPEAVGELVPDLLAKRGAGVLLDGVVDDLREVLVGPVAAGESDQREPRRQQAPVGEVVDRRHQLLARQVAGDAEQHDPARPGDPGQPPVARVAQRVVASRPTGLIEPHLRRRAAAGGRPRGRAGAAGRPVARAAAARRGRRAPAPAAAAAKPNGRPGIARSSLDDAGDLQERADLRAALVELAGRVQEPGRPAEGDRPLGACRASAARSSAAAASACRSR